MVAMNDIIRKLQGKLVALLKYVHKYAGARSAPLCIWKRMGTSAGKGAAT